MTTFRVMLPCDALVVDDDPDGRSALAELLAKHGFTVRQAENDREALERIAERLPSVILLDLEMPVMNGWELLASLQRSDALLAIRVVVVSAAVRPPPGVPFVRKPCEAEDLLATIGRVRQGDAGGAPHAVARAGRP